MPEEFEVDTGELADQIREHQRLTGTESDETDGMTRRDLLVKGGVAAAAVTGAKAQKLGHAIGFPSPPC